MRVYDLDCFKWPILLACSIKMGLEWKKNPKTQKKLVKLMCLLLLFKFTINTLNFPTFFVCTGLQKSSIYFEFVFKFDGWGERNKEKLKTIDFQINSMFAFDKKIRRISLTPSQIQADGEN